MLYDNNVDTISITKFQLDNNLDLTKFHDFYKKSRQITINIQNKKE